MEVSSNSGLWEFHEKGVNGGQCAPCRNLSWVGSRRCKTGKEALEDREATNLSVMRKSGQVWEHVPEQCITASTFRRYSRSLHLAIPYADAQPLSISLRC